MGLLLMSACGASSAPATPIPPTPSPTPIIGDACLVGVWTLVYQQSDLEIDNTTVALKGGAGATFTFTAAGIETQSWTMSRPLLGRYQGHAVSVAERGTAAYTAQVILGSITENTTSVNLTGMVTLNGKTSAVTFGGVFNESGEKYTCAAHSLTINIPTGTTNVLQR
jgi:hypothetical protein